MKLVRLDCSFRMYLCLCCLCSGVYVEVGFDFDWTDFGLGYD